MQWLPWAAALAAGVAGVLQPFVPVWLFMGLIVLSLSWSSVGLVVMQRRQRRLELELQMEAAFGVKQ